MKLKRPDRFERAVEKHAHTNQWDMPVIYAHRAAKLLRDEHAWMRQMVKKVDAWACQELADNDDVIAEILKQLAQRRK